MHLESFSVFGLHGIDSYKIIFEDNSLIMVAENGSGKTTLVNIFYYFLSRQWRKLNDYQFTRIVLQANSKEFSFEKKNFNDILIRQSRMAKRYSPRITRAIVEILNFYDLNEIRRNHLLRERICQKFDISSGILIEILNDYTNREQRIEIDNQVKKLDEQLEKELNGIQIVYLPTYRRIEKDLKNIFPHLEESMREYEMKRRRKISENPAYIELVEFGMDDVEERVQSRCYELKNYFYNNLSRKITGSYLEDILNKTYKSFNYSQIKKFDSEALAYLLNRLDDSIISSEGKKELKNFVEKVNSEDMLSDEDKINAFFVWKLFQIYEDQQNAEKDMNQFVAICNKYIMGGKHFEYDRDNFKIEIILDNSIIQDKEYLDRSNDLFLFKDKDFEKQKNERLTIEYRDLSSGEKQIVSLFSHLILNTKKYFIIIDEPELSLSVPWQEKFLPDIINSGDCEGLLAVTHSPFIFANKLKKYSHGLEEFTIN